MVLHGIALYDLVSYVIYFACSCVVRFVARAVSRKTPIPLILQYSKEVKYERYDM